MKESVMSGIFYSGALVESFPFITTTIACGISSLSKLIPLVRLLLDSCHGSVNL
jgi:hypothetical protein